MRCNRRQFGRHITLLGLTAMLSGGGMVGCGYTVGNAFQAQVRTVAVPIFKSESFRRGLEFQLTEAVQREIQNRTPFRIAPEATAETRLVGRIIRADKKPLSVTPFNDPRQLEFGMAVEVRWEDLRSNQVLAYQAIPITPDTIALTSNATFAVEVGQTRASAERKSIEIMARSIVDLMETPW